MNPKEQCKTIITKQDTMIGKGVGNNMQKECEKEAEEEKKKEEKVECELKDGVEKLIV